MRKKPNLQTIFLSVVTHCLESRIDFEAAIGDEDTPRRIAQIAIAHPKNLKLAEYAINALAAIKTPSSVWEISQIGRSVPGAAKSAIEFLELQKDCKLIEDMIFNVGWENPSLKARAENALEYVGTDRAKLACSCLGNAHP